MIIAGPPIDALVSGNSLSFARTISGFGAGVAVSSVKLKVKNNPSDLDEEAFGIYTITRAANSYGLISQDGSSDGTAKFSFAVPSQDSGSSLTVDPAGSDNAVIFASVARNYAANKLTVTYEDPASASSSLSVGVSGNDIVVSLGTDISAAIVSTASQVAAAVNSTASASALVSASAKGSGSGTVTAIPKTTLSGGNGGTSSLEKTKKYYYIIQLILDSGDVIAVESGYFSVYSQDDTIRFETTAVSTHARAASTGDVRADRIINNLVDPILGTFRQIRVWDEHARRSATDPGKLLLTYRDWNPVAMPEVWDAQNNRVAGNRLQIDYNDGTIYVDGDDGYQDYFVTYEFDFFPARTLKGFLDLTLQELNISGAANGGFITTYATVSDAPSYWDAPLAFGAVVKAFRRLASDSGLWQNRLIWADGSQGPELARGMAEAYDATLADLKQSIKKLHLIANPSFNFSLYMGQGVGFYGLGGNRFQNISVNRLVWY